MGRRLVWCWALHCVRAARLVRDIALAELHGAVLAPVVNLQAGERRLGLLPLHGAVLPSLLTWK